MTDLKEISRKRNSVEYEKSDNADELAITSEIPSNITKDSERFKSVTVWIVCFVNLIYYADRFGIAGINDIHIFKFMRWVHIFTRLL